MSRREKVSRPCVFLNVSSLLVSIQAEVPAVESIVKVNDTIDIFSENVLSGSELDAIDTVLSNFVDSDPDDLTPVIVDVAKDEAKTKHFHNIDYKKELTITLQRKSEIVQGEVRAVEWYKSMTSEVVYGLEERTYHDLVLRYENEFVRDATGLVIYKQPARKYMMRNGEFHEEVKQLDPFFYEDFEKINEGHKRRRLLVTSIQIPVLKCMQQILIPMGYNPTAVLLRGRSFLDDHQEQFDRFVSNSSTVTDPADVNYGRKKVVVQLEDDAFNASNLEWLNKSCAFLGGSKTIRQYLIEEFTI